MYLFVYMIRYLAPTSIFANFSLLLAVVVILEYGFSTRATQTYPAIKFGGLPTFFGIAVFG